MSTYLAFVLSLGWVLLLIGATVLNYLKGRTPLFYSSVFVLAIYAITHLVNVQWLMNMPAIESVKIHYLLFSCAAAIVGIGLFWINRNNITHMMGLAIFLLGLEAILIFAVHVDRNVMALNFNLTPNLTDGRHWFLWDIKNVISTLNNFVVVSAVVLGKVYQVHIEDENEGFQLSLEVEAYAKKLPESISKEHALELLDEAANAFCYYGSEGIKPRLYTGEKLLKDAVQLVRYEPNNSNVSAFKRLLYWLRS